jgi:aminopeptidase N
MKAAFLSIVYLMFFSLAWSQQTDSIKKFPPARWTRSRNIDVKHLALDLRFDWKKKQAYGIATITFSPFVTTEKIALDAGMLTINSIKLTNGTSLKFEYDGGDKNDGLAVTLDRVYRSSEELTIKIDYHTNWINRPDPNFIGGSIGKGIRFFEPSSNTPIRRRQIWSAGEPELNRYWFPGFDAPNDLRTTEFKATVEKNLTVISNGNLVEVKENPDGTKTFHYKADKPYPNYLTSFVVGEYTDVKRNFENIDLHTFGYPDEKEAVEATIERLPDMVKYFSGLLDSEFPNSQFTQVVVQDYPFPGGIGQHGAVTVSDNMIDDFRTHADFLYLWDGIESEGVLSQWFGNSITHKDWSDVWLSKSFTHYFDGLYTDYKNGRAEYLIWYHKFFELPTVANDWNIGYRHPIVTRNYSDANAFVFDNHAKLQGALVLRMLRKELGEENWWKAIRHYIKSNTGKQVTTADFRDAIEETTGQSLDWFFDQWIYKMGRPSFEVSKKYDASKKQLSLTLKQTQKVDPKDDYPQVRFFKGKMEIEIDGKIEQILLEAQEENTFTFNLSKEPQFVHVDFESTWIKDVVFQKPQDEWLAQLKDSRDVLAKWEAIDSLSKIAKNEKTPSADKEKIISAFRNTILSNPYWRLKNYAIIALRGLVPPPYDQPTIDLILNLTQDERPYVRASAINSLGFTKDPKYADIYLHALTDQSDRVINAAAIALGRSKSPKAFDALVKLKDKPSWKSQSLISSLNGLKELGDPRGVKIALAALTDIKSPRWWLAAPIWDYPIPACETLAALGKADKGYPIVHERFKKAMAENDYSDIFHHVVLVVTLADPRGQEVFDLLKVKFKNDSNAMVAVNQYEAQFKDSMKK